MMRKKEFRSLKKRILSVALSIGLVAGMVPFADFGNHVSAAEKTVTSIFETTYQSDGTVARIRGVLDKLEDLPDQGGKKISDWSNWYTRWQSWERGTTRRPFVILELVPYYDVANVGYLAEGCEPVDMKALGGYENVRSYANNNYSYIKPTDSTEKVYFFPDEAEGKRKYYFKHTKNDSLENGEALIDETEWEKKKVTELVKGKFSDEASGEVEGVSGYYELVKNGTGEFKYEITDGILVITKVKKEKGEKGNLVWHTVNKFLREEYKNNDKRFKGYVKDLSTDSWSKYYSLSKIGDRVYTFRKNSTEDPCYDVTGYYAYYKSNDVFAHDVLNLSDEDAANYSILVKTITPEDLNAEPRWVDVVDLMYINSYNNQPKPLWLWRAKDVEGKVLNRFSMEYCGKTLDALGEGVKRATYHTYYGTYPTDLSSKYSGKKRDIKWEVAAKIITRIASAKNYMGLIIDKGTVNNYILNEYGKDVRAGRYKLETNERVGDDTFGQNACDNNVFKLWVMTTTVNPNIVKKYFIDNGRITVSSDGYTSSISGRTASADEATWWSGNTFYMGAELFPDTHLDSVQADQANKLWEVYEGNKDLTGGANQAFVNGHVYIFNEGDKMADSFVSGENCLDYGTDGKYKDFNHYIDTNKGTREVYKSITGKDDDYYDKNVNGSSISSWAALRYILDIDKDNNMYYEKVRVLDIEPSVALGTDKKPVYKLDKMAVAKMLPLYTAYDTEIEIEHMQMTEFVGRLVDLNSKYDLIYLGEDAGGFWTGKELAAIGFSTNVTSTSERTDFYDNSMDGLVYFHMGDIFFAGNNNATWKQKVGMNRAEQVRYYLKDNADGTYTKVDLMGNTEKDKVAFRQPGNDLTNVKKTYLEQFLNGGFPIVAADHLFNDYDYVQYIASEGENQECVMYNFMKDNKDRIFNESRANNVADTGLEEQLRNTLRNPITIKANFKEYEYKNKGQTIDYLPRDPSNRNIAYVEFEIRVPEIEGYSYKIYFDKDRNAKFDESEVQVNLPVSAAKSIDGRKATIVASVPNAWVGFVQWKAVVYEDKNPDHRCSLEGCAANNETAEKKNPITALQICSNRTKLIRDKDGNVISKEVNNEKIDGIETYLDNSEWTSLYEEVEAQGIFDITVDLTTWEEFDKLFEDIYKEGYTDSSGNLVKGEKFVYQMDKPEGEYEEKGVTKSNPNSDYLDELKNKKIGTHPLGDYNMIIVGFGDGYGITDMRNYYGAGEYLYYFSESEDGGSILFTHDLASFYGVNNGRVEYTPKEGYDTYRTFGYTCNTMFRDILGINRYGIYSAMLQDDAKGTDPYFRSTLLDDLKGYRNGLQAGSGNSDEDKANRAAKKITYDWTNKAEKQGLSLFGGLHKVGNDPADYTVRGQYKYLIYNPDGTYVNDVYNGSGADINNTTNKVYKLNRGQITEYPFTLEETMSVATTHAQYHELNIEEPGVTVWYTLEDNGSRLANGNDPRIYGVAPHYASCSYYIYSKGNIFYSGVGHSTIGSGDGSLAERKLFVNTMIAAYRPKSDAPYVEVTGPDVEGTESPYTIRLDATFSYEGNTVSTGDDLKGEMFITFIPRDDNNQDHVYCRAHFKNEYKANKNFVIYDRAVDGSWVAMTALDKTEDKKLKEDNTFYLTVGHEYAIKYDKSLVKSKNIIQFVCEDAINRNKHGFTVLNLKSRPMFRLG